MAPSLRRTAAAAKAEAAAAVDALDVVAADAVDSGAASTGALYDPLAVAAADDAATLTPEQRVKSNRRLPVAAQFPLVAILSFASASLGYSLLSEFSKGELAAASRSQDTWGEVAILSGWRLFVLALGWFGNFDSLDVATMDLLSHGPTMYLLETFYHLSPATAISAMVVDTTSAAVPFFLLRPLSAAHKPGAKVHNRELVDISLQLYTSALSTAIYTVVLILSLRFVLPRIFVLYFSGLPTIEPAYSASYAAVLPVTLVFGAAASLFIFAPFVTTGKASEDDKLGEFDPAKASLGETFWWNAWGYTAKTKVIVRRTAIISFVTAVNTYLFTTMTIYGIEPTGAATYASVWVFAAICTGVGLGLVGGE